MPHVMSRHQQHWQHPGSSCTHRCQLDAGLADVVIRCYDILVEELQQRSAVSEQAGRQAEQVLQGLDHCVFITSHLGIM